MGRDVTTFSLSLFCVFGNPLLRRMYLIAVILVIFVSQSLQLIVHGDDYQSYDLSRSVKRSHRMADLKPKELYFCSLKARRLYALRSMCGRSHQLQQGAHHCSSRTLLMMRIDHQLAYLQRLVMLAILQKVQQKTRSCNNEFSSPARIDDLKADISLLQQQHTNLTRHQANLTYAYPRLLQMRDNLIEGIEERKTTHSNVKNILFNLNNAIGRSEEGIANSSIVTSPNITAHFGRSEMQVNLTACSAELDTLIMDELNCSIEVLPKLQQMTSEREESLRNIADNYGALQDEMENCRSAYLQCEESDICDKVQTTAIKANQSSAELQQVTGQLAGCSSVLTSLDGGIERCETTLRRAHDTHHKLLVNVTTARISGRETENAVIECETRLSTCHENVTACADLSADLEDGVAACWADLDKWKFRSDLCDGQLVILLQSVNATEDYIGDMRSKLSADRTKLEMCEDRQLYHRSSHARATHELGKLTPQLNTSRAALDACLSDCPHLRKPAANSRCPATDHDLSWHEGSTGCFFVTRPGAGHSRMRRFCAEQAPGATIARLSSRTMAEEAYEALLQRYMNASRTEPLRRQHRAWVDFEDGFEFAGYPARSPQCQTATCACWTMRVPWKGRSQLYECEEANLPAICFTPLVEEAPLASLISSRR